MQFTNLPIACLRWEGRYVDAQLPTLPMEDGSFDLALCSHLMMRIHKKNCYGMIMTV